jgi:hypothetical protein
MNHTPKVIHFNDALGNTMHVAVCFKCYNGIPRREEGEARKDLEDHLSNPVPNIAERPDYRMPETTDGPNLGDWSPGYPIDPPPPSQVIDEDDRKRAEAMARLEARLARM